jgi:hypothetical protein
MTDGTPPTRHPSPHCSRCGLDGPTRSGSAARRRRRPAGVTHSTPPQRQQGPEATVPPLRFSLFYPTPGCRTRREASAPSGPRRGRRQGRRRPGPASQRAQGRRWCRHRASRRRETRYRHRRGRRRAPRPDRRRRHRRTVPLRTASADTTVAAPFTAHETPFGDLPGLALAGDRMDRETVEDEHAVELLLPGVAYHLGRDLPVGAVVVGPVTGAAAARTVARRLLDSLDALGVRRPLWLVSSDATHYGPGFRWEPWGRGTWRNLAAQVYADDAELIGAGIAGRSDAFWDRLQRPSTVCGRYALGARPRRPGDPGRTRDAPARDRRDPGVLLIGRGPR